MDVKMKKIILIILTLVPILIGWLINVFIHVPKVGMALLYVLPFVVLVFWFWLGRQYAKTDWRPLSAIIIGSASGLISLALYIWQFHIITEEARNIFLAALSQMYFAAVPEWIFAGIGIYIYLVLHIIALVLMIAVFTFGYLTGRSAENNETKEKD